MSGEGPGELSAWYELPIPTSCRKEQSSQDTESCQETSSLGYSNPGSGFPSKPKWTELFKQEPWAWQLGTNGRELSLCEVTQKEASAPLSPQTCLSILW